MVIIFLAIICKYFNFGTTKTIKVFPKLTKQMQILHSYCKIISKLFNFVFCLCLMFMCLFFKLLNFSYNTKIFNMEMLFYNTCELVLIISDNLWSNRRKCSSYHNVEDYSMLSFHGDKTHLLHTALIVRMV